MEIGYIMVERDIILYAIGGEVGKLALKEVSELNWK